MATTKTLRFGNCKLDYARLLVSEQGPVIVNTEGYDVACVELLVTLGSGTTWRVAVKKTNINPFIQSAALSSAVTLQSSTLISGLFKIESQYITVEASTLEASHTVDVFVHLRGGGGLAVSV